MKYKSDNLIYYIKDSIGDIEMAKFLCVMMVVYFTVLLYSCRCLIGYRVCRVGDKKDKYMNKFSASMSVVIVIGLVMNAIAMYISR